MKRPFISVVTYGRNDSYAPSYSRKVGRATNLLAGQLESAGIDSEIILVEWNPAADRPRLFDMFEVRGRLRHVAIRCIVVEGEHHSRFLGAEERGFHVVEAANAGIRRARGRFVVPKSSDTFFSQALIERLARTDLDPTAVYRANRHDVAVTDEFWDLDDASLLSRFDTLPSSIHEVIVQPRQWALRDLHTNACGDFMLMASDHWNRLRGFPLYDSVLTLDADSLALHAAAAIGVRECRWPDDCRVYKPLHDNLSGSRVSQIWPEWQRALDKFLAEKVSEKVALRARVMLDYPRRKVRGIDSVQGPSIERNFVRPASRWYAGAPFQPSQPESWGLRDVPLEERTLCIADWEPG